MQPRSWAWPCSVSVSSGRLGPPGAARAPLRFAWLSDTHIGSDRGAGRPQGLGRRHQRGSPGLSFVLVTGDVTDMGLYANFRAAKDILDGLDVPYHIIPGNHDTKWSESGGSDFRRIWGDDRFAFESGGFRFIGVSQGPVMKFGDGHFAPQDVRWLDEVLAQAGAAGKADLLRHATIPLDAERRQLDTSCWTGSRPSLPSPSSPDTDTGTRPWISRAWPGSWAGPTSGRKTPRPGTPIVEIGAKAVTFAERTAGRTSSPWHRIELEKNGLPVVAPSGKPSRRGRSGPARLRRQQALPRRPGALAIRRGLDDRLVRRGHRRDGRLRRRLGQGPGPARRRRQHRLGIRHRRSGLFDAGGRRRPGRLRLDERRRSTPWTPSRAVSSGRSRRAGPSSPARASPTASSTSDRATASSGPSTWPRAGPCGVTTASTASSRRSRSSRATSSSSAPGTAGSTRWTLKTGKPVWTWTGERPSRYYSPAACWPVAAAGRVFVVTPGPWMTALDLASGQEIWGTDNLAVRESIGISADGRRVYVRTTENVIAAVGSDADSQETVWETDAGFGTDNNSAMLAERDGVVFYGTRQRTAPGPRRRDRGRQVEAPRRRRPAQHGDAAQRPGRGRHRLRRPRHPRLQR
ncbi:MAG: metallophosphoesterase [Marinilabiliales bacterium]|nr:metallophosphoesterase [Marinilabiliales bacterium]